MGFTWSNTIKSSDATVSPDGKTVSIKGGWAVTQENITSGKHYFEFVINAYNQIIIGITQSISTPTKPTESQIRGMFGYDGNKVYPRSAYGTSYNATNTIGIAIDMDKGEISFTKDGVDLGVAFSNLKDLGEIKLYVSTSTTGGNESLTIVDDLEKMKYSNFAKNFLFDSYLILQNPIESTQPYSLSDSTLIHLPDNTNESIIKHGIEKGKYIQLDVPFTKHRYFNNTPVANASGKVFTHDIGKINTLSIKELVKNRSFEPIFTWYETNMTSNTAPSPLVASASSINGSLYEPFRAFDGITVDGTTYNTWATASNQHLESWVKLDFGTERKVNIVALSARRIENIDQMPKTFTIEGSNDNTQWTELGSFSKSDWQALTTYTFNLQYGSYRYYRITNHTTNGANVASWCEIKYGYKREVS